MDIKRLSFAYRRHPVIKNLTLSFPKGKITTLLGSNGCGKSTLFKLCTKELTARSGEIRLDGKNIRHIGRKEFAKKVAIVHQKNTVAGDMTVRQLIEYGRTPYLSFMGRMDEADDRAVEEAIAMCGLTELANRRVDRLSGGQVQRVWIAMAIAQQTETLFLDEPTTYLDVKHQLELLRLIRKLNRETGQTVVMVLHDINQSIEYSDEVVGMKDGSVLFQGPPKNVLTPETISNIYDTPLDVGLFRGRPIVLPKEETP